MIGAIEAGGTKFVLAIAAPDGALLDRVKIDTRSPAETFADMAAWFAAAEREHGPIGAFGIASFGPIDIDSASPSYGTFGNTPKPGWSGASFADALKRFEAPIALDTDVNGAALGEYLAGAGKGARTLAYTTIGTGIGTGIVTHGKPLAGISHYESGHIRPQRPAGDDWEGSCPFHGACLEGLACGPSIKARWGHDLSAATPEQIQTVAGYIAELAATLVLLHMPEKMIFGGGVMKAPGLLDALRKATREKLNGYVTQWDGDLTQRILPPGLGDDAGITGAIALGRAAVGEG
ncbi:ROK family protein [Aurantiacibacter rhizosphaerae]|uniref:fructokinase n=1 Tax=Aurantiacibacter rhizosphaerae TaxID=2691582 RepID=A0A844XA85_9SPHN|nr:ROK family protein [Aurantiacibacter rhizosphaerae]MWV26445.1 ROK family protein [Aurantiacibacter rhizosphaerae]